MTAPLLDRLVSKIAIGDDCWEWTAQRSPKGYGRFQVGNTNCLAHRVVYEAVVGPIPEGLELDHLCRNRGCVNPDHLEPVTHAENMRRGVAGERLAAKTHCSKGHVYDEANTYRRRDRVGRNCRACMREAERRYRERMR